MKNSILIIFFDLLFISIALGQEVPVYRGTSTEIVKLVQDNLPDPSLVNSNYKFSINRPAIPKKLHPSQFGIPIDVNYKIRNPGKLSSWTVQVESEGALGLELSFTEVTLSEGSKIYIYNSDRSNILGPIDVRSINIELKSFSSIPMVGNKMYIHVIEGLKGESEFTISNIVHGFKQIDREIGQSGNARIAATSSTACIPDATCLTTYADELDAVVFITEAGWIGTGTFLNNENQDRRGFILTAYHLVDTDNSGTVTLPEAISFASGMTVEVDFRSTTCNGPSGSGVALLAGGSARAWWKPTDFALLELTNIPNLSRRVTYAGWN